MNNLQKIMRIAQEGGFASDEETLDPCTYRLVHMFRTMLNSKIQAGVPFNVAVLELSNTINIRQLTINNLLSEYSPEELSAIDIDFEKAGIHSQNEDEGKNRNEQASQQCD